jgi:two-component system, NtrC family, response regulator AtoC
VTDDLEITRRSAPNMPKRPMLLVAGDGKLSTHWIAKDHLVVGRAPDCDLPMQHASVSRRHAVIRVGPPFTVQDLGSTNGTRIAREIHIGGEPVPLQLGDSFRIGVFSCLILDDCRSSRSQNNIGTMICVEDPTLQGISALVRAVAASAASVLVVGETGVGKEVLAQSIHRLSGRAGPCLRINCAALAESLLESELFGHEKGAFTGAATQKVGLLESAHGGTAFLDEIGELAPMLQAKLLRALEAGEITRVGAVHPITVNLRFIAATNRDLAYEVAAGRFRADLYYRLDGVSLWIPPLRARRDQIVPLALEFVSAAQRSRESRSLATAAFLACLENHDWPGNVRELKATVERALLIADGADLEPSHVVFSKRIAARPSVRRQDSVGDFLVDFGPEARLERERIIEALDACAGNQTRAAKRLGFSRATLTAKLALYRIPRPRA